MPDSALDKQKREFFEIEGIVERVELNEQMREERVFYRLQALLRADDGNLYQTILERERDKHILRGADEVRLDHMSDVLFGQQKYESQKGYVRMKPRVNVYVAREGTDDMPIYRVMKQYRIVGEKEEVENVGWSKE